MRRGDTDIPIDMDIDTRVARLVASSPGKVRTGQVAAELGVTAREAKDALTRSATHHGQGWWSGAAVPAPRSTRPEIGVTGTDIFGGMLGTTDYNPDLRPPMLYDEYDKMRLSDGTVRGGLEAVKLPIVSASWHVTPGDESDEAAEVADLVRENLLGGGMSTSWDDTLRNILLFLDYGSMPMEPVYEIRDWRGSPRVWLRKLAPRMPRTINEWLLDDHGGLMGVKQETASSGGAAYVTIQRDRLLLFVHQQEGSNFRGHSILRAARKHWDLKRRLEIVDAMGIAKRNHGVDVGTLSGAKDSELEVAGQKTLMSIQSHEKMFVQEHEGRWKYRVQGIEGATLEALPSITYHDGMILRSFMAEFVALGSGTGQGSFAMHKDKSSLFMLALQGIAKTITNVINSYLIPLWVGMNYTGVALPKLAHTRLDTREAAAVANAVSQLVNSGTVRNTPTLERAMLELLDLPEPGEGEEVRPGPRDDTNPPDPDVPDGPVTPPARMSRDSVLSGIDAAAAAGADVTLARKAAHLFNRAPRGVEYMVDFLALSDAMDGGQERIVAAARRYQERAIEVIWKQLVDAFANGSVDELTPASLNVPPTAEAVREIEDALIEIAEAGRREAVEEVRRQGLPAKLAIDEPVGVLPLMAARARTYMETVLLRVRTIAAARALDAAADGELTDKERQTLVDLSDNVLAVEAGKIVQGALSVGRKAAQRQLADEVSHAVYSSLLDGNTCEVCERVDALGKRYEVGSPEYLDDNPPLNSAAHGTCQGYPRCRCQMILVLRDEQA